MHLYAWVVKKIMESPASRRLSRPDVAANPSLYTLVALSNVLHVEVTELIPTGAPDVSRRGAGRCGRVGDQVEVLPAAVKVHAGGSIYGETPC